MPKFGKKKCQFWARFGFFWPKIHYDHYNYPKFWTVFNVTWWKRPGHQKMTQNDKGHGSGRNYGETAVFMFGQKVFFWPKIPKKHQQFLKRLIFTLEKATSFFEQLFLAMARTWLELRSGCFFGPDILVFGRRIRFLP